MEKFHEVTRNEVTIEEQKVTTHRCDGTLEEYYVKKPVVKPVTHCEPYVDYVPKEVTYEVTVPKETKTPETK